MNTILTLLILLLGSVQHLTLSQSCTNSTALTSGEKKIIRTTDLVNEGFKMSIKVEKLQPCDNFRAVIFKVKEANGRDHEVSFPAEGKCWEKKTQGKKLKGEVIFSENYLTYHLSLDECMLNIITEKDEFTSFQIFTIVGHGQSYWCIEVKDLPKDPPKDLKPPPFKCHSNPTPSTNTPSTGLTAELLLLVGWVVGGLVVVVTVVVAVLVVWCVWRRRSSPSLVRWRRAQDEQPPRHGHVRENSLYEPFSSSEEGPATAAPKAAPHVSHNSLYEPFSALTASSGRGDTGCI